MKRTAAIVLALALFCSTPLLAAQNYIFFRNNDSHLPLQGVGLLKSQAVQGAQVVYAWRELEPEQGHYDFSRIDHDLQYLSSIDRKLFIQLQDRSFTPDNKLVPGYMLREPQFEGGVAAQYDIEDGKPPQLSGWVAMQWNSAVRQQFQALITALGKRYDGKIAGINLPESAADFILDNPHYLPSGFTPQGYASALRENMLALKKAFPESIAMAYLNFLPGEFLPWDDQGLLSGLFAAARENGIAVGEPDVLPNRKAYMNNGYKFLHEYTGKYSNVGMAIQEGGYSYTDPETGKRVTPRSLARFASGYCGADIIFWGTQDPYFSTELPDYLK